ncbi:MAG: Cys-tRNA(Pro) deacylase [Clostridiales bacterium]|nr:Cys-tRNA(Pro) deacylase [Candidatus Crickella merdequi]
MFTSPATEALDAVNASYECLEAPGAISGEDYSKAIGAEKAARLFKTLVMKGDTTQSIYVFVVPALAKLSQKATAKALGEHALEMIKPIELKKLTGYVHGGTSPLGMKNQYRVIFDQCAGDMPAVIINGGGGGYLVELTLDEFAKVLPYELMPLIK